jgi:hypothetical protein
VVIFIGYFFVAGTVLDLATRWPHGNALVAAILTTLFVVVFTAAVLPVLLRMWRSGETTTVPPRV